MPYPALFTALPRVPVSHPVQVCQHTAAARLADGQLVDSRLGRVFCSAQRQISVHLCDARAGKEVESSLRYEGER